MHRYTHMCMHLHIKRFKMENKRSNLLLCCCRLFSQTHTQTGFLLLIKQWTSSNASTTFHAFQHSDVISSSLRCGWNNKDFNSTGRRKGEREKDEVEERKAWVWRVEEKERDIHVLWGRIHVGCHEILLSGQKWKHVWDEKYNIWISFNAEF